MPTSTRQLEKAVQPQRGPEPSSHRRDSNSRPPLYESEGLTGWPPIPPRLEGTARRILEAARELADGGITPSASKVSDVTGYARSTCHIRVGTLRGLGLWPWPPDKSGGKETAKWWAPSLPMGLHGLIAEHLPRGERVGLTELSILADVSTARVEHAVSELHRQGRWHWQLDRRTGKSYLLTAICQRVRDMRCRELRDRRPRSSPEIPALIADWRRRERERRRA